MSDRLKSGHQEPHIADTTNLPELPEGWCWVHLNSIADIQLGQQRAPDHAAAENPIPYIRAANITWAGIDVTDVKSMGFPNPGRYSLEYGDVLLSEASGSPLEAGKPAIWRDEIPGACYQKTVIRIRAYNKALALPEFLHVVFLHDCVTGKFARLAPGVGIVHLTAERMIKWPVPLAPIVEQRRLVQTIESYFTRLDDSVATLERVERNLKRYRTSVLKAAVEGRLVPTEAILAKQEGRSYEPASVLLENILTERRRRWSESGKKGKYEEPAPPDTTNLPELPQGWCWVTLNAIAGIQLGQQRAPDHAAAANPVPYVRAANITWDGLDLSDVKAMGFPDPERYLLEYGDVLLSEASGSPMEAGKPAIWRNEIPGACCQKTVLRIRPFSKAMVLPEFLRGVFLRDCFTGKFARLAPGVGIVHLTAERMFEWPVPLAPITEQRRIAAEIDRLGSAIDSSMSSLNKLLLRCARFRQSILKFAFEGKLVDQDPKDEPASVLLERIKAEREAGKPTKANGPQRMAKKKQVRA